MQFALSSMVQETSERDSAKGLELLREEPWSRGQNFLTGAGGYLEARAGEAEWLELRGELIDLVKDLRMEHAPETRLEREMVEIEQIDRMVMRHWATEDLESAIDWFASEAAPITALNPEIRTSRTVEVLTAVPADQRSQVFDWIDAHRSEPDWSDTVVVDYARAAAGAPPDPEIEWLAALPAAERDRATIVSAFAMPHRTGKGGPDLLRHPPESLLRLIEAARLSPAEAASWRAIVENAQWPGE